MITNLSNPGTINCYESNSNSNSNSLSLSSKKPSFKISFINNDLLSYIDYNKGGRHLTEVFQ